jgi:hypothetical protein
MNLLERAWVLSLIISFELFDIISFFLAKNLTKIKLFFLCVEASHKGIMIK